MSSIIYDIIIKCRIKIWSSWKTLTLKAVVVHCRKLWTARAVIKVTLTTGWPLAQIICKVHSRRKRSEVLYNTSLNGDFVVNGKMSLTCIIVLFTIVLHGNRSNYDKELKAPNFNSLAPTWARDWDIMHRPVCRHGRVLSALPRLWKRTYIQVELQKHIICINNSINLIILKIYNYRRITDFVDLSLFHTIDNAKIPSHLYSG